LAYQKSIKLQSKLRNRINRQITNPNLRVIADDGKQLGVLTLQEALRVAEEAGLDLIEVDGNSTPGIAKIADWGKFRYEGEKKMRKTLSANKGTEVKSITISLKIGEGDLDRKLAKGQEFMAEGHRVRIALKLKGRENAHTDLAFLLLERICAKIEESAAVEQKPTQNGRNFSVVLKAKK
jgi:translation initiation factor IF-3